MSKIGDKLARNPNDFLEFHHNGQIKDFLNELNIESKFKAGLEGERIQAVQYGEHPSHFILIVLWSGYAHRQDNGHFVWCLPKRKFTFEKFMEFSKRVLKSTDDRTPDADISWTRPGNPTNQDVV